MDVPFEQLHPDYKIYRYTDDIYKVIKFKRKKVCFAPIIDKEKEPSTEKFDSAISRARKTILELALCNDWTYFCTFTLDPKKYDRFNLDKFHKDFSQFIRDQRKKHGLSINFLLVPEQHKDGAWHMHGLFNDISVALKSFDQLEKEGFYVPAKLVSNNYFCYLDYWKKFGYCSFGLIENKIACGFYITKYVSKTLDQASSLVGQHLYYASRGLNRSSIHGEVYGNSISLDSYLTNHYEFCETGFTHVRDNLDFTFAVDMMDVEDMISLDLETDNNSSSVDEYFDYSQMVIGGYDGKVKEI